MQGRYLISHSHTANWRESQLALQSEFPTLDLQEVPASEPRPVLDSSRVRCQSIQIVLRIIGQCSQSLAWTYAYAERMQEIVALEIGVC